MSSTPRFFVPPEAVHDGTATLPTDAAHHARNVLRLKVGEAILLHDGSGTAYRCRLEEVSGARVTATVEEASPAETEPTVRITVAQALPKTPDKMEQVLQHGTEIGASGFVLFGARRSVAKLEGDKVGKRLERWESIVRGAAEQSGRAILPPVVWLPSSNSLAASFTRYDAALVLHESATTSLRETLRVPPAAEAKQILVIIGPEGGLTEEEVALFSGRGASIVTLGPRVLRTETAALVALAQIL